MAQRRQLSCYYESWNLLSLKQPSVAMKKKNHKNHVFISGYTEPLIIKQNACPLHGKQGITHWVNQWKTLTQNSRNIIKVSMKSRQLIFFVILCFYRCTRTILEIKKRQKQISFFEFAILRWWVGVIGPNKRLLKAGEWWT